MKRVKPADAGVMPEIEIEAEVAFRQAHPALSAALATWREANPDAPPAAIRITSRQDGFRRAGVNHPAAPVEHPADAFGPDALELLLSEPKLTVTLV
jgi:hypothetical protein